MMEVNEFAALRYYAEKGNNKQPFEKLSFEKQEPYLVDAQTILNQIEKMNLMLTPLVTLEETEQKRITLKSRIEGRVKSFLSGLEVFKRDLFPTEELVAQIYEEVSK